MIYRVTFKGGNGSFVRIVSVRSRRAIRRVEDRLSHEYGAYVFAKEARDAFGNQIPVMDIPLREVK